MKTITRMAGVIFIMIQLMSCGPGQLFGPTYTPTSTNTSTYTHTPTFTATFTPTRTKTPTITPLAIINANERVRINDNVSILINAFEAREVHFSLYALDMGNIKCLDEGKKCLIIETKNIYGNIIMDDVNKVITTSAISNTGDIGIPYVSGSAFSMGRSDSKFVGYIVWAFYFDETTTSYRVRINGIEIIIESPEYFDIYKKILFL